MGASIRTLRWCVCLGRVPRGCSRRPTSTAHEEVSLQRYRKRGGGSGSLLAAKNGFTDVPSKQAFLGARPHEDPRRRRSSMRAEASTELEEASARASHRSTGPVSLRHLRSTAASEQSSAADGTTVDKPLKNVSICTH